MVDVTILMQFFSEENLFDRHNLCQNGWVRDVTGRTVSWGEASCHCSWRRRDEEAGGGRDAEEALKVIAPGAVTCTLVRREFIHYKTSMTTY